MKKNYARFFKIFVPVVALSMLIHIGLFRLICDQRLYIPIAGMYLAIFTTFLLTRIIENHLFPKHPYGILIDYLISAVVRIAVVVMLVLPLINPAVKSEYNVTAEVLNLFICYLIQLTAYNAIFPVRR